MARLEVVTAHFAPHANLFADPHGGTLPPAPPGGARQFSHCIQGSRGPHWNGDGPALYPKGFPVGPSYSPMTYLTGELDNGDGASHDDLERAARQLFGADAQPVWLYRGCAYGGKTSWWAAWRAHNIGQEPCRAYEFGSEPGRRLASLLTRITGGDHLDMGHTYGAQVYLPDTGPETPHLQST